MKKPYFPLANKTAISTAIDLRADQEHRSEQYLLDTRRGRMLPVDGEVTQRVVAMFSVWHLFFS